MSAHAIAFKVSGARTLGSKCSSIWHATKGPELVRSAALHNLGSYLVKQPHAKMHKLDKSDLPELLHKLDAKLESTKQPPFNIYGYLRAYDVMRKAKRSSDAQDEKQWFVDRWPDFHVILLQEGSASDSTCPMRAVWAQDTRSAAALFANPSFRASEVWLGGVDPALLDLLRDDYDFHTNAPYDVLALGPADENRLPTEAECQREDLRFDSVVLEDAEQVARHVTYPCSADYIRTTLSCGLPSIAARRRSDGALVAWALTEPYMALGKVNVMPELRRTGLGRTVVSLLARQQLDRWWTSYAYISDENVASKQLFTTLGYKVVGRAHWARCRKRTMQS